jgi:hypothetical protein
MFRSIGFILRRRVGLQCNTLLLLDESGQNLVQEIYSKINGLTVYFVSVFNKSFIDNFFLSAA